MICLNLIEIHLKEYGQHCDTRSPVSESFVYHRQVKCSYCQLLGPENKAAFTTLSSVIIF